MPAPNEDFWTDLNTYGSPSWRFGNSLACSVQGFSISFGLCSFCGYFIGLNLYYVFSIGLRLSNITIEKYIEPIIHLVTITWALWATVPPLFHHGYNAVDVQPFCAMSQRPNRCIQHHNNNMNATECMIDFFAAFDPGQSDQMFNLTAKLLGVFVTICLTFVCYRVFYYERQIISTLNQHQDGTCNECCTCNDNNVDECCQRTHEEVKYEETKVIIFQSAIYVLCVLIGTFAWFIYSSIPPTQTQTTWQQITLLALSSLQGLFCLCFFMVHKVYTLKRLQVSYHQNNKKVYNMSTWSAIKYIIKGGGVENSSLINMDILLPLNAKTYGHNHNSIETKRDSDDSRISSVTNEYGDRLYKKKFRSGGGRYIRRSNPNRQIYGHSSIQASAASSSRSLLSSAAPMSHYSSIARSKMVEQESHRNPHQEDYADIMNDKLDNEDDNDGHDDNMIYVTSV